MHDFNFKMMSSGFLNSFLSARFEALHLHWCAAGGPGRHRRGHGRGQHRGRPGHPCGQGDLGGRPTDDPCASVILGQGKSFELGQG